MKIKVSGSSVTKVVVNRKMITDDETSFDKLEQLEKQLEECANDPLEAKIENLYFETNSVYKLEQLEKQREKQLIELMNSSPKAKIVKPSFFKKTVRLLIG